MLELLLLRQAERKLGVCRRIAQAMPDRRNQGRIRHDMLELGMARAFAITCGDKDGNDLNRLRHDPLMMVAIARSPESGDPLASQSTISRLENAPRKAEVARVTGALVDQFCVSVKPGKIEIFDIDDTSCVAHLVSERAAAPTVKRGGIDMRSAILARVLKLPNSACERFQ